MKTRLGMLSAAILMASSCLAVDDGWWNETVNRPVRIYGPSGHEVSPPPLIPIDHLPLPRPESQFGLPQTHQQFIYRLNYIELDVDCDDDGILDCEQILDGTYSDHNYDGIPDCCVSFPREYILVGMYEDLNGDGRADYCIPYPRERWPFDTNTRTLIESSDLIDIDRYTLGFDVDCNGDGIVDCMQILDGTYEDLDGNGILDCCEDEGNCELCTADVYPDGTIDISDLLIVIAYYGQLEPAAGDVNMDGQVDSEDILDVLDQWGTCDVLAMISAFGPCD